MSLNFYTQAESIKSKLLNINKKEDIENILKQNNFHKYKNQIWRKSLESNTLPYFIFVSFRKTKLYWYTYTIYS